VNTVSLDIKLRCSLCHW